MFHLLGLAVTRPPLSLPWNSGVGWRDWGSPPPSQGRHFGPDGAAGPHGMAPYLGRGLAIEVRGGAGDPRAQDSSCGGTRASPLMKATWWATGLFPWVVAPPGGSQGTDVSGAPPLQARALLTEAAGPGSAGLHQGTAARQERRTHSQESTGGDVVSASRVVPAGTLAPEAATSREHAGLPGLNKPRPPAPSAPCSHPPGATNTGRACVWWETAPRRPPPARAHVEHTAETLLLDPVPTHLHFPLSPAPAQLACQPRPREQLGCEPRPLAAGV